MLRNYGDGNYGDALPHPFEHLLETPNITSPPLTLKALAHLLAGVA